MAHIQVEGMLVSVHNIMYHVLRSTNNFSCYVCFLRFILFLFFFSFFSSLVVAAVWTSYFLMLLVNAALVYFIGKSTKMSFDYVLTLAFIHFILSMLVMLSFPVNWIWWVTAILGHAAAAATAELSCYYLRDMRSIKVEHE